MNWSVALVSQGSPSPSSTWQINISRTAEKQIQKLDRTAQKSIVDFLRERVLTSQSPRQFGKPLHGDEKGLWRYRVGDHRLICDIQDDRLTVLVLRVGHRREIYR
ncbi:MAG: type II toxin-antitoxin system RelE/ParE family toxin [Terriglobales bacterium]|jgi:mRNA interferase RelE/StbE